MSPPAHDYWLGLAAEVGSLLAPAGLNYIVPGTTSWVYRDTDLLDGPPGWAFVPTGVRVGFDAESLRRELARVRALDARWRAALRVSPHKLPPPGALALTRKGVERVARELPEFPLRACVWRAASLLRAVRFAPEYDPDHRYLFEMLENGLTFVRVRRAGPGGG